MSEDGTAAWHRRLHHTRHGELSEETAQTSGMRRSEAISGKRNGSRKIWMGESRIEPATLSGDHHHGESETGIFVLSGHPVFVFLEDGAERRVETSPGDYVYVPPFVPHREENPSPDEPAVVVLARSTQEGIVVNLPGLDTEVPELGRAEERAAVEAVVLDYFEGWFDGDAARMERALHPGLAKRALLDGGSELDETSADWMIRATGEGVGRARDPGDRRIQVEVEEVHGSIATALVRSTVYREYVHLVRTPAGWKIVNTLYAPA
jgi:uncharacterized RmlC-like cupin family protein